MTSSNQDTIQVTEGQYPDGDKVWIFELLSCGLALPITFTETIEDAREQARSLREDGYAVTWKGDIH